MADTDELVDAAKKLHAETYLRRGYIEPKHIDKTGVINRKYDPHQDHSTYFVVRNREEVVATARQIRVNGDAGHASFPTMAKINIYKTVKAALEGINPIFVVEISGLAKSQGTQPMAVLMLYRTMWQYSLRHEHRIWLASIDEGAYSRLKFLFGDALVRIGNSTFYMGSIVIPVMLEVDRSIYPLLRGSKTLNPAKRLLKRQLVKFFLDGLPKKYQQAHRRPRPALVEISKASKE